jgi:hypothetical protein
MYANAQDVLLKKRLEVINQTLQKEIPVILLDISDHTLSDSLQKAFIADSRLKTHFENKDGEKMLNEIFNVSPARQSDISPSDGNCSDGKCYRIEMYNYASNSTIIALIHATTKNVVKMSHYPNVQPDLPNHLVQLAVEIAKTDTVVVRELAKQETNQDPLMAGTKTALNRTHCQRSKHLCVAPTFIQGTKALWAIVDLTELKVAGTKWTNTGDNEYVTERTAQNHKIMDCFCDKKNTLDLMGWKLDYSMTRSDGLKVYNISYEEREVIQSMKVVDWHVSYSNVDAFGYSDAMGCPEYSTAAVLAVEAPKVEYILSGKSDTLGFKLIQEFYSQGWPAPCNYNYYQHFEFYKDGRFRPVAGSVGRGCGINGTYRPVTRIAPAKHYQQTKQFDGHQWTMWNNEKWTLQTDTTQFGQDQAWFQFASKDLKDVIQLSANIGQYGDNGRGDNAFIFITNNDENKEEGEADLPAIGTCCNQDYHQGPEIFMEPEAESIINQNMVIWYVPQIMNDNTPGKEYCWAEMKLINGVLKPVKYPCLSGPMLKIITGNEK